MEKPQQTAKNTRHHATREEIEQIKTHLGHIFDVDGQGNITLKDKFKIPEFKMIFVRGGELVMGDERWSNYPPHEVELTYNFFIGELPVTQEFFRAITGKNPSQFQGLKNPVERLNWMEAVEFCNLLNQKIELQPICNKDYGFLDQQGKKTDDITEIIGFRLPTETEWEYAARGGYPPPIMPYGAKIGWRPGGRYAGSNYLDEVGWYDKNNDYETKPVGLKFPNALGIYDMSGNVWEWCLDWYEENFYKEKSKLINPANFGKGSVRLLRGGFWNDIATHCRTTIRGLSVPGDRLYTGGFRLLFAFQFT